MTNRSLLLFAAALSLGGAACNAPTSYHLVSNSDSIKALVTADSLPTDWQKSIFDDSKWQAVTTDQVGPLQQGPNGQMPNVAARRHFDLGAEAMSYKQMKLTVQTEGSWTAFLNGQQVAVSGASTSTAVTINVPDGSLLSTDNVLAVQVQPVAGTAMLDLKIQLDGAPDKTASGQPQVLRGPWLTSPTPTGVTVVWETNVAVPSTLVVDTHSYDGGAGTHHQVTVTDLESSKSYPYHVEVNGVKSEESQLATAAKPGERVRFVVFGDNRTNGDAHRRVVEAIEAEGPDFLVNTGDLVFASNDTEWDDFFNIEYSLIRHTPLFPTLGNHEGEGGATRFAELFPIDGRQSAGGSVYGADFGDVHIAAIDSNGDLGKQATWLDQDLTAAEQRGAKHLFVFMHWGPYSSGTMIQHGSNGAARDTIARVAKQHNVDALFSGHDHFYERGVSDNLNYYVTGGGGAPLMSSGHIAETQMTKSDYHYIVVDVSGSSVTASAKDASGAPIDIQQLRQ
jgi:3',5'-cyclic AMP phosphodiesterase CpdA